MHTRRAADDAPAAVGPEIAFVAYAYEGLGAHVGVAYRTVGA
jgi:hypothetical protein